MNSFLWKIYLSRFFDSFILIGVIFALLFNENGLNPLQISSLLTIWSITTIVTEVPFGVLADTYSRKNLLILGLVLRAIGFCFWMAGGYINYAIGFILWGLKNTLTSGTLEGLVYDELAHYKKEEMYEEVNGKMSSYFSLGLFLSAIFGGIVAQINYKYVLIISIATTLFGAVILSTIKSVKPFQSTGESNFYKTFTNAIQSIQSNKVLLYIIIFNCIIFGAFGAVDEFWSLIFVDLKLNTTSIGLLVALVYGVGTIAGQSVKYFDKSAKDFGYILIILGAISYLAQGVSRNLIFLPITFLGIYLFQIANIKISSALQKNITSKERSTISSIQSLLFELSYMSYLLVFGFIGTQYGIFSILTFAGIALLIIFIILLALKPTNIQVEN